ncbi:MAG: MBL fold metallo-hydrolase [Candidatus Bathyarchaeia archaeon]
MKVIRIVSRELSNNTYLVVGIVSALIDPSTNTRDILKVVKEYKPRYIILTHSHFDHAHNLENIKLTCGAKILAHPLENFEVDEIVEEGDEIELGDLNLKILHTPGHTPGSICLYEEKTKSLFSGDTVFSDGSFGRTDLTGGSLKEMVRSLEKLSRIDVEVLYPGHGIPRKNARKIILNALKMAKNFLKSEL